MSDSEARALPTGLDGYTLSMSETNEGRTQARDVDIFTKARASARTGAPILRAVRTSGGARPSSSPQYTLCVKLCLAPA
jgi:hypothetical protein